MNAVKAATINKNTDIAPNIEGAKSTTKKLNKEILWKTEQ